MNIQLDELLKNIYKNDAEVSSELLEKIEFENYSDEIESYNKFKNNMIQKGTAFLTIIAAGTGLVNNAHAENIILNMANIIKASNSKEYIHIEENEEA